MPSTFAGEERMTGALLDRYTHRLEVLTINDTEISYRVKQSPSKTLSQVAFFSTAISNLFYRKLNQHWLGQTKRARKRSAVTARSAVLHWPA